MSITATLDGATYSNATSITASDGEATKTITLSESGGGGSFASGNFTPSENTYTQVINTGLTSVTGFAFYLTSSTAQSVRVCSAMIYDPTGGHAVLVGSNVSGASIYATPDFRNIPDQGTKYTVSISGGTITITTTDNSGTGYFIPTQYNWFAW